VSKGHWTWEEYGEGPDKIEAAMTACKSGWFMFGDEWEYQHYLDPAWYPMEQQIEEARWYIEKRDEVNPDCKLAFGGILTFHKLTTPKRIAVHWVPEFYDAYVAEYGEAPDVQAIVLDDYYWATWFYLQPGHPEWSDITAEAVGAIRDTYGDGAEVWAREIGSLMTYPPNPSKYPMEAMNRLDTITPYYDRYAWFISRESSGGYWDYTALWLDGELSELGEMYKEYERPAPWGP